MAYFRDEAWNSDEELRDAINEIVGQGLQRSGIPSFLERDFLEYMECPYVGSEDAALQHLLY